MAFLLSDLAVLITAASVQDRDAAHQLLWALRCCFPRISLLWADGGYGGKLVAWVAGTLNLTVQIVRNSPARSGSTRCPAGGWLSAACRGSTDVDEPSGTTNGCPNITPHGSNGHHHGRRLQLKPFGVQSTTRPP